MKNKKTYALAALGLLTAASLSVSTVASAATAPAPQGSHQGGFRGGPNEGRGMGEMKPGIFGSVTAISGTTLTVSAMPMGAFGHRSATSTAETSAPAAVSYSVDASSATVMKNNATSSVSSIAVGDKVAVEGTVSGTSVTATMIRDGIMAPGGKMGQGGKGGMAMPQGDGQPVVAGSITSINGSTILITNKSNLTYTVDAASANIQKAGATSTVSSLSAGDSVVVQGAVNGTSITASMVIDQARPAAQASGSSSTGAMAKVQSFFGGIGGFFTHLFGF